MDLEKIVLATKVQKNARTVFFLNSDLSLGHLFIDVLSEAG